MGNKIVVPCIPKIDNRIESYSIEEKDNKKPITIEGNLSYLDEHQILFNMNTCCICMDSLSCVTLDCGHNDFCWNCIRELSLKGDNKCPICRQEFQYIQVPYNLSFKVF